MNSFEPVAGATVNIDVSSASQSVALGQGSPPQVLVTNNGTATVWITFGVSGVSTTLATGTPIGPGVAQVFTVTDRAAPAYVAAIAAGSTGKIYFTPGRGI